MTNKTAFLTTIFPMKKMYLMEFFSSIEKQTVKDFDVIVVNDGYSCFEDIRDQFEGLNIIELKHSDTPAKNREHGINYTKDNGYNILIFGDSDDCFDPNRVQVCEAMLSDFEIVVNDLSLFNENGVYDERYFSNRVENRKSIVIDMIIDKNIFGLSNTAIRLDIINNIDFNSELVAVDWYLFSVLLLKNKSAVFTNEALTYYRQYSDNTVGMKDITKDNFRRGIEVKLMQYEVLSAQGWDYLKCFNEIKNLKQSLVSDDDLDNYISLLSKDEIMFPFWWENIRLLRDSHEIN